MPVDKRDTRQDALDSLFEALLCVDGCGQRGKRRNRERDCSRSS